MRGALACWVVASALTPASALAYCFDEAGKRYGVSPKLLRAVARVESGFRADAINRSHEARTGSYDIGLMQVNSRWLPQLARYGIDEMALRAEPCTNVHVGAWILSSLFARLGPGWDAVGAYNASCATLKGEACARARLGYAWRVYRAMQADDAGVRPAPEARQRGPRVARVGSAEGAGLVQ